MAPSLVRTILSPLSLAVVLIATPALSAPPAPPTFETQLEQAYHKLDPVLPVSSEKLTRGELTAANDAILAAFPEATRTPVETFLLGNILFEIDRKLSYTFHQTAAKALPDNPEVQWEWAMELHRAGQYADALAVYQKYSKAKPKAAASYGLQADCLLRLDRIPEAIKAWQSSEKAPNGDIEQFENLVCAIHREPMPEAKRAELLAKVTEHKDLAAAADLIVLDCDFPRDWWNHGPRDPYLDHDAPLVETLPFQPADDVLHRAITCAVECTRIQDADPAKLKAALTKHQLIIDPAHTLPTHGDLLSLLVTAARESKAISETQLHEELGPRILALAKAGHDVEMWNAAAASGPEKDLPAQIALERAGWEATADPRFAAALLSLKRQQSGLTGEDPDLQAAVKQFPEDAAVQHIRYEVAVKEKKLTRALLAQAARAEFHHFSAYTAFATVVNRPRAGYLRLYFKQMATAPAGE